MKRGRLVRRCPVTSLGLQCTLARDHDGMDYARGHRFDPDDAGFTDSRRLHNKTRVPSLPIRRGKRPKPISDRRASERNQRAGVVAFVVQRDETCQAQAVHALAGVPCSGPLDCHEIIMRSAWQAGIYEESNCLLICRSAHTFIHNRPLAAHAMGLRLWSWERHRLIGGGKVAPPE